ncbi:MAG TPA: hypothetical protein VNN07_07695 [Candidatus Tectomicrobia bacterium]|nr:hypothetical protein [Candidatus Tectomicrobia bacterium]
MNHRILPILAAAALAGCATGASQTGGPTRTLHPLVSGAERHLQIDWDRQPHNGAAVVWGYLHNTSPYTFDRIRVLVDALDPSGNVVAQQVSWVPGILGSWGRRYFQVAMPPAANYQVRIFSYDRVEGGDRDGFRF